MGGPGLSSTIHDSPLFLADTLDTIQRLGELPDRTSVHLDRAYDSEATREKLAARRLRPEISEKGKPAPVTATKRWVVERTSSLGKTSTRRSSGVPRGEGGSSTSGWPSPRSSSSSGETFGKPGPATAGRTDLHADRDLLAQALSR
jgi:hypothetical protein